MKHLLFFFSFLSLVICNHYAISSERSYSFDENVPGRQLLTAAIKGDLKTAEFLLKKDSALVGVVDFYGRTPLKMAVSNNRFELADFLLDYGAPADFADQVGRTPIMSAVFLPNDPVVALQICRRLQKKGANIDNDDIHGNNALMLAAYSCVYKEVTYSNLFNFLVKNTSDLDQRSYCGRTALHYAAISGNLDAALRLVLEGVDVTVKDNDDRTACDLSVLHQQKQVQELLSNPHL